MPMLHLNGRLASEGMTPLKLDEDVTAVEGVCHD
jgi:hypothetical protein